MLAKMIRGFCQEYDYEIYENYTGRYMFGRLTIGIVVKEDQNYFDMLMQLTSYLEAKGFNDPLIELEGTAIDDLGLDTIIYFPNIQNYP